MAKEYKASDIEVSIGGVKIESPDYRSRDRARAKSKAPLGPIVFEVQFGPGGFVREVIDTKGAIDVEGEDVTRKRLPSGGE